MLWINLVNAVTLKKSQIYFTKGILIKINIELYILKAYLKTNASKLVNMIETNNYNIKIASEIIYNALRKIKKKKTQ